MELDFTDIVERIRENADKKLQPETIDVDGSQPHIYLTLDAPVQVSRLELLTKLAGEIERSNTEITLSFLDAARTEVNGKSGIRYRLRVDEIEGNPLENI